MDLDEFFAGWDPQGASRLIFEKLRAAVDAIGPAELRVTKSQIAFHRRKAFAWAWIPARYLRGNTAPLVLTIGFSARDPSPRWKEIVEPVPGRFTHHLELFSPTEINAEVLAWLENAWSTAA
jgi:hypothetical protein